jgi:hypothetical protein
VTAQDHIPIMRDDDLTSPKDREAMLICMREASATFYRMATRIGCHAFIEFTGLMNEYIKLCEAAHEAGVDFTKSNVHTSGAALPMQVFHAEYLGEKLECIYGHSFAGDPQLAQAMLRGLMGPDHEDAG